MPKPFLICSAGRTGSTFLQLSLHSLEDVYTDYEMIYWPSGFTPSKHHVCLPAGYRVRNFIEGISQSLPISGSRLTIGYPLKFYESKTILDFVKQYENLNVVFLYRNHFDILISRSSRLTHDLTDEAQGPLAEKLRSHNKITSESSVKFERKRISFESAKASLINIIEGELICLLIRKINRSMTVKYDEIKERFFDITRFIGSSATQSEAEAVLSNPPTTPTRRGTIDLFEGAEELHDLCRNYDKRLEELITVNPSTSDLLSAFYEYHSSNLR